jgi:hypothetical protein
MRQPPCIDFLPQGTLTTTTAAVLNMPPQTLKPEPDLMTLVPKEYHDFLYVFEQSEPLILPLWRYIDPAINLEPRAKPFYNPRSIPANRICRSSVTVQKTC